MADINQIANILKQNTIDILLIPSSHDEKALFRELMLLSGCQPFPIKKVLLFHGGKVDHLYRPGSYVLKLLTRLVLDRSDSILVLSSEEQDQFQRLFPNKAFLTVDNPFIRTQDNEHQLLRRTYPLKNGKANLLFVGRLIKPKGIYVLLEAMQIVLNKVNCHLTIVGDGPEIKNIKRYIYKSGLDENITLEGYLQGEEYKSIFCNADIFILPSWWNEGFPTVITEAMDAGLPIVTTKWRGAADHLQEGVNTLFVPPKDSIVLAQAILTLLEDPGLRLRMGNTNREKVKDFAPAVVAKHYLSVFEKVLDNRPLEQP